MTPKHASDCMKLLLKITVFLRIVFSTPSTAQCTPYETERSIYAITNVGIKLCQLKCVEKEQCLSTEYNIDTLTCRLSRAESKKIKKDKGYVIFARNHSRVMNGACTSSICSFRQRCLETRSRKAICVQDEKQNYPGKSLQHKIHKKKSFANSPIHEACRKGDLRRVTYILSDGLASINSREKKRGRTPLMVAAEEGHCSIFNFLINKGASVLEVDNDCHNTLHWACQGEHVGMLECVFNKYDINAGKTPPLVRAAFVGNRDLCEFLVCMGANVSVLHQGYNALHWACTAGQVSTVRYLIKQKIVDVNSSGKDGRTPLMTAVIYEHRVVFELLVRMGANVSQVDVNGANVLHCACRDGHLGVVEYLLSQSRVDVNSRRRDGRTPLMEAALRGKIKVFRFLVSMGANVSHVDVNGHNSLHLASSGGRVEMVKYILSLNLVDINARDKDGETAAMTAKRIGKLNIHKLLVSGTLANTANALVSHKLPSSPLLSVRRTV